MVRIEEAMIRIWGSSDGWVKRLEIFFGLTLKANLGLNRDI